MEVLDGRRRRLTQNDSAKKGATDNEVWMPGRKDAQNATMCQVSTKSLRCCNASEVRNGCRRKSIVCHSQKEKDETLMIRK